MKPSPNYFCLITCLNLDITMRKKRCIVADARLDIDIIIIIIIIVIAAAVIAAAAAVTVVIINTSIDIVSIDIVGYGAVVNHDIIIWLHYCY